MVLSVIFFNIYSNCRRPSFSTPSLIHIPHLDHLSHKHRLLNHLLNWWKQWRVPRRQKNHLINHRICSCPLILSGVLRLATKPPQVLYRQVHGLQWSLLQIVLGFGILKQGELDIKMCMFCVRIRTFLIWWKDIYIYFSGCFKISRW